jgi:paraquat-inducible protein B
MAKQANRKMIGVFVVIAVVILAASVVIFGSGEFFKKKNEYVLYFDGSVKGLKVGSPVLFRGVQVGSVKSIVIRSNLKELKAYIPVIIEVYPESFEVITDDADVGSPKERLPKLIEEGLRAQLVSQSMITGQLMIEVDMYPDTPVVLRKLELDKEYMEIPTIPSTMARLGKALEKLDLKEISAGLTSILASIDGLLRNPDIEASLNELKAVLKDARGLVQNVNANVGPLTDNLNGTISDARKLMNDADLELKSLTGKAKTTLDDYGKLARHVDAKVDSLSNSAIAAMDAAKSAIKSIDGLVGEDSPTRADLDTTLQELSGAARSLRILADYLEQHPDAIIKGKGY